MAPNNRRRRQRTLIALIAILGALSFAGTACTGNDDADSPPDSDTQVESANPGDGDSGDIGPGPGDPEAARERLESAISSCEVLESLNELFSGPSPTSADEAKVFVDTYVTLVEKMAETTSDVALGERLSTAATNLGQFGEDVGYDPARLNLDGQPDYEGAVEDLSAVEAWLGTETLNCQSNATATP